MSITLLDSPVEEEVFYDRDNLIDILPGLAEALQAVEPPVERTVQTKEQLAALITRLQTHKFFAMDTETCGPTKIGGLDIATCQLVGMSFTFDDEHGNPEGWYVPVGHISTDRQLPTGLVLDAIRPHLENIAERRGTIDFHHAKYDLSVMRKFGVNIPIVIEKDYMSVADSMIKAWLVDETMPLSLKEQAWMRLRMEMSTFQSLFTGKNKKRETDEEGDSDDPNKSFWEKEVLGIIGSGKVKEMYDLSKVAVPLSAAYAKDDTNATWLLNKLLTRLLHEEGLWTQYYYEMSLLPCMVDMAFSGVKIDLDATEKLKAEVEAKVAALETEIKEMILSVPACRERVQARWSKLSSKKQEITPLENEVCLGSSQLKRAFFYEDLGLADGRTRKTKTGGLSTDRWAMQSLVRKGNQPDASDMEKFGGELAGKMLEHTKYNKLLVAFLTPLPLMAYNGRIFTSFNPQGTATGRFTSQNPNLQQMPRKGFRHIFTVDPGYNWVSCDLSQIELRLAAHFSLDANMVAAYMADEDIHTKTAILMSGKKPEDFICEEYPDLEAVNKHPEWSEIRTKAKACYHPDTEVLTRKGWKRMIDLEDGEEIIQAWPEDGGGVWLEWVVPTDLFTKIDESGKLYHLKNESVDIRVTPDHRMLGWGSTGKMIVTTPDKFNKVRRYANAGRLIEGTKWGVDPSLLRLAVATQADGSYQGNRIEFGFVKKRKLRRLIDLLEQAGFENFDVRNGEMDEASLGVTFVSLPKEYADQIKPLLDENKQYPWWWLDLPEGMRKVVLEEAPHWDGSVRKEWTHFGYYTTERQSADVLQAVAAVTNRKSSLTTTQDKRPYRKPLHTVSVKKAHNSRGENVETTVEDYNDLVTCLSVPSSFILVRDQGKTLICGQCNFGILYGMSGPKLYDTLVNNYGIDPTTISPESCEETIQQWLNGYPGIREFIQRQHILASNQKYVTTILGRKRRLKNADRPGPKPPYGGDPAAYQVWREKNRLYQSEMRISVNTTIQGSAADLMKIMMVRIHRSIASGRWNVKGADGVMKTAKMLTQVHDELNFEVPEETAVEFFDFVKAEMASVGIGMRLRIPIKGDGGVGPNWDSAK